MELASSCAVPLRRLSKKYEQWNRLQASRQKAAQAWQIHPTYAPRPSVKPGLSLRQLLSCQTSAHPCPSPPYALRSKPRSQHETRSIHFTQPPRLPSKHVTAATASMMWSLVQQGLQHSRQLQILTLNTKPHPKLLLIALQTVNVEALVGNFGVRCKSRVLALGFRSFLPQSLNPF